MRTFSVSNRDGNIIDRTTTENVEEACAVAKVMSRSTEHKNSAVFFVEDDYRCILFIFNDGIKFVPEEEEEK